MGLNIKKFTQRALDLLLPPVCLMCDAPTGAQATLCPDCWKNIRFVAAPFCACCGAPFDIPIGDEALCGACLADPPPYRAARAAMIYDEASRKLILGFKHGDRTHATKALGAWMHRAGGEILSRCDAVVPVPLHRWRLFKRRYNQSALLAKEIAEMAHVAFLPDALVRTRATPSQGHRKRKERRENVRGAFAVPPNKRAGLDGKSVVLIDDVMTTGATVEECARVLLKAGAAHVDVLTLARVKGFD